MPETQPISGLNTAGPEEPAEPDDLAVPDDPEADGSEADDEGWVPA